MTQRVVHRPVRERTDGAEPPPIVLPPPPALPSAGAGPGLTAVLMPVLGGAGSLVMILANRSPVMLIAGGVMLAVTVLGAVVLFVAGRTGSARRATDLRHRYLDHLDGVRDRLADAVATQRSAARADHPDPDLLPERARDPVRVWQRRPGDADFLVVRVGVGVAPLRARVQAPRTADQLGDPDPAIAAALARIVDRDRMVSGMPVTVALAGRVAVVGPAPAVRATATALLAQLVTAHAPDDVRILLCVPRYRSGWLDWLKWPSHLLSVELVDGTAPARQVFAHPADLTAALGPEISRRVGAVAHGMKAGTSGCGPALVVVLDSLGDPPGDPFAALPPGVDPAAVGLHLITLVDSEDHQPSRVDVTVGCRDDLVVVTDRRPDDGGDAAGAGRSRGCWATAGRPDVVGGATLATLAAELAGIRLVQDAPGEAGPDATAPHAATGPDPAAFDPKAGWVRRNPADFLRVPFGVGPAGEPVVLDLKEPAQGGMGPHGLCVGATGSGKSEALRTLVLNLAVTHPPEALSMVLVDYKGGATFAGSGSLPHCAAMVSNLSDDAGLVDRLSDALGGELKRRQRVLAAAGNVPDITEYRRRRDAGDPAARLPLPHLLVVIDEFGELLTAKPDFIELFLAIGRIGRSIGVHLLLASQRLEEGRLRGLESFLSYRLGLRTFNAAESRSVLGVPDAYELPSEPGVGYLKVDTTVFQRFRAGYVSGPARTAAGPERALDAAPVPAPYPLFNDTASYLAAGTPPAPVRRVPDRPAGEPTVLDVAVGRMAGLTARVPQLWLPPLPPRLGLAEVGVRFPGPGPDESPPAPPTPALQVVVGLLDRPAEQRQHPLMVDLAASGGHLAVLGAPQTGKSTALRTLMLSAAATHRPGEVAFYCLDLGGGALRALAGLPHVAGVAGRGEGARIRRTVAEVAAAVTARESLFAAAGIDSVDSVRARWRAGRLPELPVADVFLVCDNYPVLRGDFDDLTEQIQDLATRGPAFGVHLVLTAGRWADLRLPLQATIGTKIELRLNDAAESIMHRRAAANLRADQPGRCLIDEGDGLVGQICLPRSTGAPGDAGTDLDGLVARIAVAHPGGAVPPVRLLPTLIRRAAIDAPPAGLLLGVGECDLAPVGYSWAQDGHLIVLGDQGAGKTSLLRLLAAEIMARHRPDQAVFGVFDLRRTLLDVIDDDFLGAYAGTVSAAAAAAAGIAGELAKRLPPDDVTAAQLRTRSWWQGPEVFVFVDDCDLLPAGGAGPLAPLLEYLPQARDVGLHVVATRRSGGCGRALYEPFLQRLRDAGASALLLSGDRSEGAIYPGVHLSPQPPGRATLVRRGRTPGALQLAYLPEPVPV